MANFQEYQKHRGVEELNILKQMRSKQVENQSITIGLGNEKKDIAEQFELENHTCFFFYGTYFTFVLLSQNKQLNSSGLILPSKYDAYLSDFVNCCVIAEKICHLVVDLILNSSFVSVHQTFISSVGTSLRYTLLKCICLHQCSALLLKTSVVLRGIFLDLR